MPSNENLMRRNVSQEELKSEALASFYSAEAKENNNQLPMVPN
jgi:hypothetical protein